MAEIKWGSVVIIGNINYHSNSPYVLNNSVESEPLRWVEDGGG